MQFKTKGHVGEEEVIQGQKSSEQRMPVRNLWTEWEWWREGLSTFKTSPIRRKQSFYEMAPKQDINCLIWKHCLFIVLTASPSFTSAAAQQSTAQQPFLISGLCAYVCSHLLHLLFSFLQQSRGFGAEAEEVEDFTVLKAIENRVSPSVSEHVVVSSCSLQLHLKKSCPDREQLDRQAVGGSASVSGWDLVRRHLNGVLCHRICNREKKRVVRKSSPILPLLSHHAQKW